MNKHDRLKLTNAGFTLLRIHESPELKMTYITGSHSWSTWKKFESNAEMNREVLRVNDHEPFIIFEN